MTLFLETSGVILEFGGVLWLLAGDSDGGGLPGTPVFLHDVGDLLPLLDHVHGGGHSKRMVTWSMSGLAMVPFPPPLVPIGMT